MAVYVDNFKAPYGRMFMCHMIADTQKELLEMADNVMQLCPVGQFETQNYQLKI